MSDFSDSVMNDMQKLQLQNMIKANNIEDQTNLIRDLKHSQILRNDVNNMLIIKNKYKNNGENLENAKVQEDIYAECAAECTFLFTYYTDIFNKIRKDEIDLSILYSFFDVLQKIEIGELDQHEGSFIVGNILKKMYVDSALKKADKLNEQYDNIDKNDTQKNPEINISWKEFKNLKF